MSKGQITGGGTDGLYDITVDLTDKKDGVPQAFTGEAWCADLTEDLSGNVGVLEIAGDLGKGYNIQPGHDGNAVYDADRDGIMKRVQKWPETHPAGEVFWNWAMRAGWQKWRPNYRYGSISNINYDAHTCDVTLDACYATDAPDGRALDINQASSLSGVSIDYMDCDSSAFENGDRVIVEFENNEWGSPKIIGFESEPQPCAWEDWKDGICGKHDWWYYSNLMPAPGGGDPDIKCPSLPQSYGSAYANITDDKLRLSAGAGAHSIMYCLDTDGLTGSSMRIRIPNAVSVGVAGAFLWLRVDGDVQYFDFAGNLHGNDVGFNGGEAMTINFEASEKPITTVNFTVQASGVGSAATLTIDYILFF